MIYLMAGGEDQNPMSFWLMMGLMLVVFYFFMIRPQTKKAKAAKQFRESLGKGTRIVTIGGIHGKIVDIKDETVTIEVEGGQRLKLDKTAVAMDSSQKLSETTK